MLKHHNQWKRKICYKPAMNMINNVFAASSILERRLGKLKALSCGQPINKYNNQYIVVDLSKNLKHWLRYTHMLRWGSDMEATPME